ncbi:MAG: hypothetical protein U1F43_07850 [Myxococcota bacterium]
MRLDLGGDGSVEQRAEIEPLGAVTDHSAILFYGDVATGLAGLYLNREDAVIASRTIPVGVASLHFVDATASYSRTEKMLIGTGFAAYAPYPFTQSVLVPVSPADTVLYEDGVEMLSASLTLLPDRDYLAVAYDDASGHLALAVKLLDAASPAQAGDARVQLFDALSTAPSFDLTELGGATLFLSVALGALSGAHDLAARDYVFEALDGTSPLLDFGLSLAAGRHALVIAPDGDDPGGRPRVVDLAYAAHYQGSFFVTSASGWLPLPRADKTLAGVLDSDDAILDQAFDLVRYDFIVNGCPTVRRAAFYLAGTATSVDELTFSAPEASLELVGDAWQLPPTFGGWFYPGSPDGAYSYPMAALAPILGSNGNGVWQVTVFGSSGSVSAAQLRLECE